MSFQIQPLKEFLVRPALPPQLSRLTELAYNVLWNWDHNIRALFRRLDPALWRVCGHNPVLLLGRVSQAALEKVAADPRYVALYRRACERLDTYVERREPRPQDPLIAYFSMEYGIVECLPIYSGGLGVLSGDHLKAASDSDLPLVAVGLMYQMGYFQQSLNPDGWQLERYTLNDFYTLPLTPVMKPDGAELHVSVKLPSGPVHIKIWRMDVGRVKLYLLDTNIPENPLPENRAITDQLYGGDIHTRIRQELVLGVGGVRALQALGLEPTAYHMNEGHSAFLALERIRVLVEQRQLSFEEALSASRTNNVFTTHTSVPAGIDLFDAGLMWEHFEEYCREVRVPFDRLMSLGRRNPADAEERFSMAILACKTSCYRNAVSRLHRRVSQDLWQDLWPQLPTWEVPITSITNGVHLPSWLNGDLANLYDQYLQPDWRERCADPKTWDLMTDIPDQELWEVRRRRKRQLIGFVREHVSASATGRKASAAELRRAAEVLDPDAFTIGFARRFATYKRATLLFRDVERLKRIITNPEMPMQIVIAGKAHPKDHPGKTLIREIIQLSRDPDLAKRIVFVEDYGIQVARELVHGVDLWLNNPRRGEEACGTSGMKAGVNGVLNLSILDGWFDEAYEISGGWAIGDREVYAQDQDELHARTIYSLLENEIVPMYYERNGEGVPVEWLRRVRESLSRLSPLFDSQRMTDEYMRQLYQPAHAAFAEIKASGFEKARERVRWNGEVQRAWGRVQFVSSSTGPDGPLLSGDPIPVETMLDLGGLTPQDVRVEAVFGRVGVTGQLEETHVMSLPAVGQRGPLHVFAGKFLPPETGRLGYSLRVCPNHFEDPLTRPCDALIKWSTGSSH